MCVESCCIVLLLLMSAVQCVDMESMNARHMEYHKSIAVKADFIYNIIYTDHILKLSTCVVHMRIRKLTCMSRREIKPLFSTSQTWKNSRIAFCPITSPFFLQSLCSSLLAWLRHAARTRVVTALLLLLEAQVAMAPV